MRLQTAQSDTRVRFQKAEPRTVVELCGPFVEAPHGQAAIGIAREDVERLAVLISISPFSYPDREGRVQSGVWTHHATRRTCAYDCDVDVGNVFLSQGGG